MSSTETIINTETTNASTLHPKDFIRPLGAGEELMWLLDLSSRIHFALAAEVEGRTTVEEWRAALDALQRRHPLLSVCIDSNHSRIPHFRHVEGEPIPLRVVETVEMRWELELERELRTQFDPRQAPLMRAVLLYQESKAVFILVAHHSIADGFSLAFAIRDVLEALSGQLLDRLPLMPSREEIFGLPRGTSTEARPASRSSAEVASSLARDKREALVPQIQRLSLVPFLTSMLQSRAREEGTTVHGALCAALLLAGRQIDRGWHDNPLRVRSSVSIRSLLGLEEHCMLAIGGGEVTVDPEATTKFWELARFMKSELSGVQTRERAALPLNAAHRAVLSGMDAQRAPHLLKRAFGGQAMVTNLGRLSFDTVFGRLRLESLWGPAVFRGVEGEQTIGAATINGSLNLLHTSYAPLPALLMNIEAVLIKACALEPYFATWSRAVRKRR
jgi:Condensation domain